MPQAVACSTFFAFSIREIQSYSRLAKLAYRLGYIGLAENRRAGDDHVYARIDRLLYVVAIYASVYLYVVVKSELRTQTDKLAHVLEGIRHKLLTAEARFDAHDQYHVEHRKIREDSLGRCRGLYRNAASDSRIAYRAQRRSGIVGCLDVYRYDIRTGFYKLRYITDGIGYHEVNIEYKTGGASKRGDDTGPEADVRHENSVHNVEMQIFNACLFGAADIISEMRKVAGECRG